SAQSFANGQKADIVIGQPDMVTTFPQGPAAGTSMTTGLAGPSGLAVDASGNLYVLDTGNNRVLRFPQPFAQQGQPLPDMVIGQTSFSSGGSPNQGATNPTASSLAFAVTTTSGSTASVTSAVALDPAGNLWVADPGNSRVLRFNASVLAAGAPSGPNADMVFGQTGFTTGTYNPPASSDPLLSMSAIALPRALVFDTSGRLFVEESTGSRRGRILVWPTQVFSGQPASRLLAVNEATPQPPTISNLQISDAPGGIFQAGAGIGVADSANSRILIFPSLDTWAAGTTDQAAIAVIGQTNYNSGTANQALPQPNASTLSFPGAAVIFGSEIYIADTGNERVIVMPESQPGPTFGAGTRVLGQDGFSFNAPNLVEGREFDFTASSSIDAGIAVDLNSTPPHLYVADTYNNRILGYKDLRSVQSGQKADIVIGQPDFQHVLVNYPTNTSTPNSSGLFAPTGLVVDPAGNLYVADTGNGRVLRFPTPFANYVAGTPQQADLVLGQLNFTTTITDTTQRTLAAPYGIALTTNPGLLVSDVVQNRVLFFKGASTDFVSGMPATLVLGQPDFNSSSAGSGSGQLSSPHHISTDLEDRLYVADSGNARVQIWGTVPGSVSGTAAALSITNSLRNPRGMYVSPATGDIWVTDASTNNATRYAPYNQLQTNGLAPNATIPEIAPVAAAEDEWGNLFLADAANRVAIFYPGLAPVNAGNYLYQNYLAPGEISALFSQGNTNQFGTQAAPAPANQFPLPTQLNGIEVLLAGTPVPLFYAGTGQINFMVPNGAAQSGAADLQVVEVATGRTLGDTTVAMVQAAPGLFADSGAGNGIGNVAAVNKDGTVNSATNPAVQGDPIQIFGTGVGYIPGAPQDGYPASGPVSSPAAITVIVYPDVLTSSQILYSGLAPGEVGVWQLNITIPNDVITLPNQPSYVVVLVNNSTPTGGPALGRLVQIYVKAKP
ncbi:MAG TPA: hypothetical protein VEF06_08675, partial [Bryobacteraceae bacterium]|nr:hypothetical protein [Bryobacteraceae bacterium]